MTRIPPRMGASDDCGTGFVGGAGAQDAVSATGRKKGRTMPDCPPLTPSCGRDDTHYRCPGFTIRGGKLVDCACPCHGQPPLHNGRNEAD